MDLRPLVMNKENIILLTSTINPNGMSYTVLQDKDIRQKQYNKALQFYLVNTPYRIVYCDNSGVDISGGYLDYINSGRIEFITFNGNDFDKAKGKGYGEAKIILYAIKNSKFLKHDCYVTKITGRIIIRNICELIQSHVYHLNNIVSCDFCSNNGIYSMIIISPVSWIKKGLEKYIETINDTNGIYIENVLYKMLIESKRHSMLGRIIILPFLKTPKIDGMSGSTGKPYNAIIRKDRFVTDISYLSSLQKKKNKKVNFVALRLLLYIIYLLRKLGKIKRNYFLLLL